MTDEDLPIDLQTYRRLVTDFEREYDELFTISYSMIKHVPYVRQLLVECYNCTALFGYFQCLLTHRVTAIT